MTEVFKSVDDLAEGYWKLIDTRFSLQDPDAGSKAYKAGHIAGAVHWDLEKDLSDMHSKNGRHPMPSREHLTELFRRSGLGLDDRILIYDGGGEPFAARAWWLVRYGGFRQAYILREGHEGLVRAGYPLETEEVTPKRSEVKPEWQERLYADREQVRDIVEGRSPGVLLDARAADRYAGKHEPLDPVAGHIPGARNFDWSRLITDGELSADEETVRAIRETVGPDESVTVYCGSGVTAAPLHAMLTHLGHKDLRLYVGSYSDWVSEPDAPVENGGR
ncbi:sulfurtransferase [Edaphobacillus lindanitolerans]|uniref:Thiosulfate/3-mercaptopyruvate sulfurtransferase n=1 Tax=Edaphobacillus lindanitolerans TaxID=550447 RepID=A0A1U7PKX4_9BACI|nr:sulfurtransferase [Edaphobacillus lindanitolerans]SIT66202.1 thiosulfate/3-mercaptopyruvate sulfurtransferase [Edaphobacillus lindanitolerans]